MGLAITMSSFMMVSSECSNLTIKNTETGILTGNCLQGWCYVSSISQCTDMEGVPGTIGLHFSVMACTNTKSGGEPDVTPIDAPIDEPTDDTDDTDDTDGSGDIDDTDI